MGTTYIVVASKIDTAQLVTSVVAPFMLYVMHGLVTVPPGAAALSQVHES